jgi:hypothetical protein
MCIVHNVRDTYWQRLVPEWSRRNAIRYLPISPTYWLPPPGPSSPSYTPYPTSPNPPFHLHLARGDSLEIPPELTDAVVLHTNLHYNDFYTLIAQMDVCIPTFAGTDDRYLVSQASSAVGMFGGQRESKSQIPTVYVSHRHCQAIAMPILAGTGVALKPDYM